MIIHMITEKRTHDPTHMTTEELTHDPPHMTTEEQTHDPSRDNKRMNTRSTRT